MKVKELAFHHSFILMLGTDNQFLKMMKIY